jgi:hypothetical protein
MHRGTHCVAVRIKAVCRGILSGPGICEQQARQGTQISEHFRVRREGISNS